MKLKESTIKELGQILKKDYGFDPGKKELEQTAYSLVGYFDTLLKINLRPKFGSRQPRLIDSGKQKVLDEKKVENG